MRLQNRKHGPEIRRMGVNYPRLVWKNRTANRLSTQGKSGFRSGPAAGRPKEQCHVARIVSDLLENWHNATAIPTAMETPTAI